MRQRFAFRRVLGVVLLLALAVSAALLITQAPGGQLAAARARWAAAGTADYRIVVEISSTFYRCEQDFEVRGGQVGEMYANRCPTNPVMGSSSGSAARYTVEALFQRVADHLAAGAPCGPNGCACDGTIGLDVDYDPTFGYPTRIAEVLRPETRFLSLEFWGAFLRGGPQCPAQGYDGTTLQVRSLSLRTAKPDLGSIDSLPRP